MGKKNKNKKSDDPSDAKGSSQQSERQGGAPQQGGPQHQGGPRQQGGPQQQGGQQGGSRQQGGSQQQGGPSQQRGPPQQAGPQQQGGSQQPWGQQQQGGPQQPRGQQQQGGPRQQGGPQQPKGQQQQGGPQQQGSRQQQGGPQQQSGPRQQGGPPQQGGPQQQGGRQQQGGPRQQGGSQQQSGPQQVGPQQQSGPRQQGGPPQQGGPQQQGGSQQQGGRQQQGGPRQQGGSQQQWGSQQGGPQQQQGGFRQQGGAPQQGGRQQQGGSQQQSGRQQQGGSQQQWGSQQGGPRQQGGQQQQGGFRPQGGPQQQGGPRQRGGPQQQGAFRQYGGSQQQGGFRQGGSQQMSGQSQQQQHISNENPLPVKDRSCNGIVRGTLGEPGTVEVNYLRLNLDKMPDQAYHYDVTITPDRPKKFLRPAFEQFRLKVLPNILLTFDGLKNCYSTERFNAPIERTIEVPDGNNRVKEFQVQIKETDTCVVDLKSLRTYQNERVFDKPMRALQVLEVVLASSNHERGVRVGRSFFRRPINAFDLGDNYEAWTGLYQAAILGEMPLLNVDIAHKSFPCESTLLEYLDRIEVDKNRDLNDYALRDIRTFLNGVNIIYTPPPSFGAAPKQYKILGIVEPASRKTFKTDDGKEMTVANYFKSKGYSLKYPHLNCLSVGSTIRQIALPMELCSIPGGQALNRKDQSRQVEKMIRYAATSTNTRKQKIMDLLTYFDHNLNPIIRNFGLSIGSSFLKVPMRLLPSPCLEYLQGRTVTTMKGAWRMDGNKFLSCSGQPNGHKWAILFEESRGGRGITYHDLENFKTSVIKTSKTLNMNLQNTAEIIPYKVQQLQGMLKDFAKNRLDLVFVVLSDRGTAYAKIKQTAELEVGILTQCIKDKTIFRTSRDLTVFSNILLKVNGKLNGTNHKIGQDNNSILLLPVKNVMYLGADVTHPSPDQRHIPSVVGVAASHDPHGACYNCQYRLQRSTVENIEDMESIASRHLEVYFTYQKKYPDQIIYYRDGVSDGQFPIVEREEISAIKRACTKKRCNPKMTCVIVVKRHHTRFFPLSRPQHDRDFNNVQAGTVVDQYITHPNEVQFFMVSHQSIQGTARPTRYNVIMDENKFDINMLQKLTYNLCHLFPRCNRAVSYPAPAYLAHLVAFRGRVYLEGTQRFDKNLKTEYDKRQIKSDFLNKNPMYFI